MKATEEFHLIGHTLEFRLQTQKLSGKYRVCKQGHEIGFR